ncbi:hypothetical protein HGP17_25465 [Rhizobium sp. P38BS-XIX]|uniref:phage protease n=1 Tax=Rhizobium sp. P38BS-XIX TaxID=2726740 RepID=UPI001456524E|nr:phage protease [Rhizobium sp. P38BS-XIX]NLS00188.1 hypothetical protein [Rhizobium sp. P38BS-XIX]
MKTAINSLFIALMQTGADVPDWLHILPAAEFTGADGRGPYAKPDMAALIAQFDKDGMRLPVDENHSIDLAGKQGHPSPARGWIVELQAREDGLWGRVQWTDEGKSLVAGKAYGFLSPVFLHGQSKPYKVAKMLRVALTNDPNLTSLKSLHAQEDNTMLEELRKALGLPETADETAVMAAVKAANAARTAGAALMARVAEAAGVAADTAPDALVTAVQSKGKPSATDAENASLKDQLVSLQSQVSTLTTQLNTVTTHNAQERAETVVGDAIKEGKIIPALKDHMIARHIKNPAEVEAEIKLMPSINSGGLGGRELPRAGETATSEELAIAAMMGVDPEAFKTQHKVLFGKDL